MRFAATSLAAIAAAVFVIAQPLAPAVSVDPQIRRAPQTNAERFAAGLPPLAPKPRRHLHAPQGGSKVGTARRALASPAVPINAKCIIQVRGADNNLSLGYIGPKWSTLGRYGLQSTPTGALEVAFTYSLDSLSQIDMISTATSAAAYPYIGAASGLGDAWDLGRNLVPRTVIAGTAQTPPGSPPVQSASSYSTLSNTPGSRAESAIWKYNPVTGAITAQWVNSDGTLPATYLAYPRLQYRHGFGGPERKRRGRAGAPRREQTRGWVANPGGTTAEGMEGGTNNNTRIWARVSIVVGARM